jgi:ABC-type transport system substrate-binding protein
MYKKICGFLLIILVLSTVIAGCGSAPAEPTEAPAAPEEAAAPTEAPKEEAAEPTKAAEEAAPGEPKHGGTMVYGLVGDPPSLDPHVQKGAADATVKNMVYNRLVTWDREMNVIPMLAESWEVIDDTTVEFKLREGVKFHDGSEMTAEDVKFSYERIQDPEVGSGAAGPFKGIEVEVIDDYTVRLNLPGPDAAIFQVLARTDAFIVSKDWIEGGADPNLEMMGTGPFKYVGREPDVSFEVERFDDYYDQPLPYLDGIKFIPYKDETAKATAIRTGEVDFIDYVPWRHMDQIEEEAAAGDLKFDSGVQALFMTLYMNPSEPPFDDKRVRQAISWAVDREAVGATIFFGRGEPLTGSFIPKSFLGYDPSLDGSYGFDQEKAKALLAEVGWKDEDGDGVLEAHGVAGVEDGTPFKVNFLATNQYAMHFRLAELAQAQMKEIGIDGTVELVDWPTRTQRRLDVVPWEIQADGLGQNMTDPAFLDLYYHSEKGQWPPRLHFADPEADDLLNRARATYDEEERAKLYNELDKRMIDQVFFVYVWRREQGEAMQPYVNDFSHTYSVMSYLTIPEVWMDKPE